MKYFILLVACTFFNLPLLLTDGSPSFVLRTVFLIPLLLYSIWSLMMDGKGQQSTVTNTHGKKKYFYVFVALMFIGLFRSLVYGTVHLPEFAFFVFLWATIILFAVALLHKARIEEQRKILYYFFASIGLYVTINVAFHFLGITSSPKRLSVVYGGMPSEAVILGMLGFHVNRVLFLMSTGLNEFGYISGSVILVFGLILVDSSSSVRMKIISVVFIVFAVCGILLTDSRSPMLFAFICFLFFVLIKSYWKVLRVSFFILPILVPLVFLNLEAISDYASLISLDVVSRTSGDVERLAGRYIVWESSLNLFRDFSLQHIVGYGLYGQATSGLSAEYYALGMTFQNPDRVTLHNVYLQYIIDIGYIGLAVFLAVYYAVLKRLNKLYRIQVDRVYVHATAFIFYLGLTSLFEVSLAPYTIVTAFSVLFMLTVVLFFRGDDFEKNMVNPA